MKTQQTSENLINAKNKNFKNHLKNNPNCY